jgi:hypothetical protein
MARIKLKDILAVVREQGETGSHNEPKWDSAIDVLGQNLDDAVASTLADQTLIDLLNQADSKTR